MRHGRRLPLVAGRACSSAPSSAAAKTTPPTFPPPGGLYKRPLPSSLVSFSSHAGKGYLNEALRKGGCDGVYFELAQQFQTQEEPAYCGLGSLAMVLNALNAKEGSSYTLLKDTDLDCHIDMDVVQKKGIVFDEFACLAALNGAKVVGVYAEEASYETFRDHVVESCTTPGAKTAVVVSYSRKHLGQTGSGHFSPIAALVPDTLQTLILDVARFKYPPYWVHLPILWESMMLHDPETGRSRGYFVLQKHRTPSLTGIVNAPWQLVREMMTHTLPTQLAELPDSPLPSDLARSMLCAVPSELQRPWAVREPSRSFDTLTQLTLALQHTAMYKAVLSAGHARFPTPEAATLFLLCVTPPKATPPRVLHLLTSMQSLETPEVPCQQVLADEVDTVRHQIRLLCGELCSCLSS